jgi:molecular chaperone GrpE
MGKEEKKVKRDPLVQAANIFSEKNIERLEEIKKLIDDLVAEGSEDIKDTKKYFQHLPLITEIVEFIIKNKDKLVNTNDKDEKIKELTETLQRLQAEFENFCKRVEKENGEFKKFAKAELVRKILPVLDSFEMALRNNHDKEKFMKGVEMIYAQLLEVLEDEGLRKIEALGKKFDPYYHEVLMTDNDSRKDEDVVVEELQKGYMINEKVLRFSKVKVNKKSEEVKNEDKY